MSKNSSPSGSEIEEKRVTSIFLDDGFSNQEVKKEDSLKCAKAEMGEVKEENERLKMMLDRVEKDYHSLQLRFFDIVHKEVSNKGVAENSSISHDHETEEPEFVSLCLGRGPRDQSKKGAIVENLKQPREKEDVEVNLSLGLESKYLLSMEVVSDLSPLDSSEELPKEAELAEGTLSTNKSTKVVNVNDDISDQMPAKKARVSVRARCDTPTMNDGCQWRKYGQKIAKGNPCPRAYYRCTVAPACPVRKQVQRCADDLSILITTYEGSHNHPLPVSAAAMASTTSAAASMLLSGSSTSQHAGYTSTSFGIGNSPTATAFNGLNFNHHFGEQRPKHAFLPPNQASHLFPTVTVDLTSPINIASSNQRFSPNSLSFCSNEPNFTHSNIWGNKGFFHNNVTMPIDKSHIRPLNHFKEHNFFHQQCMTTNQTTNSLAETITKAISTDPSLHSVIAAAVSSLVGPNGNQEAGLNLKLGQHQYQHQNQNPQLVSSNLLNQNNGKGCISGYFKRMSSANSQARNFMLLQPTLPFSVSNSSTSSAPSIVNQINHNYDPDMHTHQ